MRERIGHLLRGDFLRDGAIVFFATMGVNASNYVFHFFMTRDLGPVYYGVLSSLLALTSVLSLPAAIITLVVVKYAAELQALDDRAKLHTLSRGVLAFSGAGALILLSACVLGSGGIAHYLQESDVTPIWIVGAIVATGLMTPGLRGILQGTQDFKALAVAITIEGFGKCVLGIGLAALGFGLRGALAGYMLACIISLLYALYALGRYRRIPREPLHVDIPRLLHAMLGIAVATIVLQVASYIDVILVKHYFSPSAAGIYSGVALAGKIVLFIASFVPAIVLPKAAARASNGQRTRGVLVQGLGLSAFASLGVLAIMTIDPYLVMRAVSGGAYLSGAVYLPMYALAMAFLAAASTVSNYQIGLHRFHFIGPFVVLFTGEIVGMVAFHTSIHDILLVLVFGNAALLAATFYVPQHARSIRRVTAETAAVP